jgi:hypothetical protein
MTALNFKTMGIGLASLLMVSVAHGKCYPGLDCPEDLPNANNTQPVPSTREQTPEPPAESTVSSEPSSPAEQQTVDKIVGWKVPTDSTTEESPSLTKYGKYGHSKYSK